MRALRLPQVSPRAAVVAAGLLPLFAAGPGGEEPSPWALASASPDTLLVSGYARLQTAEALAAVAAGLPGRYDYPYERLESAWRQVLIAETPDSVPGDDAPDAAEPADVSAAFDSAWTAVESVTEEAFAHLGTQMDTRQGERGAFVVFNPLGWNRRGTVRVLLPPVLAGAPRSERLVSLPDVPALGAMIVPIGEDGLPITPGWISPPASLGPNWIENGFLRVELDPRTGAITRIYDRVREREALHPGGRANVLWILEEAPAGDSLGTGPRRSATEVRRVRTLSASATPGYVTMAMERESGATTIRQELILSREAPYLEVVTEVAGLEDDALLLAAFEPAAQPESAAFGAAFGGILPRDDSPSRQQRAGLGVPGQRWADVSGGEHGLSVLTDSDYSWGYRKGRLALRLTGSDPAADPARSSGTSSAGGGPHRFRFAIHPHAGDWRAAGTHKLAAEYNVPLIAGFEPRHRGPLGDRFSLAWSEADNVNVEWVARAEDDPDVLLIRLREWFGEEGMAGVSVNCPRIEAWRSEPGGSPGLKLPVRDGAFRIQMGAYEVATVRVGCGG